MPPRAKKDKTGDDFYAKEAAKAEKKRLAEEKKRIAEEKKQEKEREKMMNGKYSDAEIEGLLNKEVEDYAEECRKEGEMTTPEAILNIRWHLMKSLKNLSRPQEYRKKGLEYLWNWLNMSSDDLEPKIKQSVLDQQGHPLVKDLVLADGIRDNLKIMHELFQSELGCYGHNDLYPLSYFQSDVPISITRWNERRENIEKKQEDKPKEKKLPPPPVESKTKQIKELKPPPVEHIEKKTKQIKELKPPPVVKVEPTAQPILTTSINSEKHKTQSIKPPKDLTPEDFNKRSIPLYKFIGGITNVKPIPDCFEVEITKRNGKRRIVLAHNQFRNNPEKNSDTWRGAKEFNEKFNK